MVVLSKDACKQLLEVAKVVKKFYRRKYAGRADQAIMSEFIKFPTKHDKFKMRMAEKLKKKGKNVFVEKILILDGIRIRPDVCYFEEGKWNIFEIEYGGGHRNNIFKNFKKLSKIANITVIDI